MGLFNWLFGERKIEVVINVPAIHVFVNGQDGTHPREDRPVTQTEQGRRSFVASPRVDDEDRLSKFADRINGVKATEVKFGQDS